jgi:hypothetical protein
MFGPETPAVATNWSQTLPDTGWFPIFRFSGPEAVFFDMTWRLEAGGYRRCERPLRVGCGLSHPSGNQTFAMTLRDYQRTLNVPDSGHLELTTHAYR